MDDGEASAEADLDMPDAPGPSSMPTKEGVTIEDLKISLYEHCCSLPEDTVFSQQDFLNTSLIPDNSVHTLQTVTAALAKTGRLKLMQYPDGKVFWRYVPLDLLKARAGLDKDAMLVLSHIESAGRDGIWSVTLRKKTNLHKVVVDKAIRALEHRVLIKSVSNARHPGRKTWMLWGLQPFEGVTGGLFFSEGDLDEEFVRVITQYIERWVSARSWSYPANKDDRATAKRKKRHSGLPEAQQKEGSTGANGLDHRSPSSMSRMRPFPANYAGYPAISEITDAVNDSRISKSKLRLSDVQSLVDILTWDGKFEKLHKPSRGGEVVYVYRAIKHPVLQGEDNHADEDNFTSTPLTEAPCGKCPVFEFCEEGGLVSPKTCPYFQDWLGY